MKRYYWALLFLNFLAMGVMVPVLSLALLDKGLNLGGLALIFGLYSLTVFILEIPSGVLADLIGRKNVFIISNIFYVAAAGMLLFADGFALMVPVIVFWGVGKAFASGSADALIIDRYIELNGPESMPVVTSRLALLETAGISAGAVIGGFLPGIKDAVLPSLGTYDLNVLLRFIMSLAITILCAVFLKEVRPDKSHAPRLKAHILESARFIKQSRTVLLLAVGMFCAGFFIFTVETYWQPAYAALLSDAGLSWTLGLLSFGCFLFASLGNIIIKKIFIGRQKMLHFGYTLSRLLLFAALAVFSLQQSPMGFAAMFFLVYFLFGGSNMAESTILNIEIPSERRASLLSFVSFVFQAGGIVAPAASGLASTQQGIRTLWLLGGIAFFIVSAVIGAALFKVYRKRNAVAATPETLPGNGASQPCADADTAKS